MGAAACFMFCEKAERSWACWAGLGARMGEGVDTEGGAAGAGAEQEEGGVRKGGGGKERGEKGNCGGSARPASGECDNRASCKSEILAFNISVKCKLCFPPLPAWLRRRCSRDPRASAWACRGGAA